MFTRRTFFINGRGRSLAWLQNPTRLFQKSFRRGEKERSGEAKGEGNSRNQQARESKPKRTDSSQPSPKPFKDQPLSSTHSPRNDAGRVARGQQFDSQVKSEFYRRKQFASDKPDSQRGRYADSNDSRGRGYPVRPNSNSRFEHRDATKFQHESSSWGNSVQETRRHKPSRQNESANYGHLSEPTRPGVIVTPNAKSVSGTLPRSISVFDGLIVAFSR